MMRRIGFFGGTFDPIHFGHLNLAKEIFEKKRLDEIWFCPARTNPFKNEQDHSSREDRLKMTELAVEGAEAFSVIKTELDREGSSYTIDTLKELTESHPDCQFYLILSDETARQLPKWKQAKELLKLAHPLVGVRKGQSLHFEDKTLEEIVNQGVVPTCQMEISSTDIRNRVKKNLDCSRLVPEKVLDYIYKNHLYLNI